MQSWRLVGVIILLFAVTILVYWFWFHGLPKRKMKDELTEETMVLYYLNKREFRLESVKRRVPEASSQSDRVEQIIKQLTREPEETELISLVPETVTLKSSYFNGETVYLDFNDELMGAAHGSSDEMMFLYSIVNSVLRNLPSRYKLVQFLVEGEMRKTIGPYGEESGHVTIQYPLGPRWNLSDTAL